RLVARLGRDVDHLEEAEVLEPALGTLDHHLVEGVALGEVELAADDIVAGTAVATDLDALDIGPGTAIDRVDHRDGAILEVAVAARRDLGEDEAVAREALGDRD